MTAQATAEKRVGLTRLKIALTFGVHTDSGVHRGLQRVSQSAKGGEKLTDAMRAVPGMFYVRANYTNSIDQGASYQLYATVECSVAAPKLADAARAFVDGVDSVGFPDHSVELHLDMHVGDYTYVAPGTLITPSPAPTFASPTTASTETTCPAPMSRRTCHWRSAHSSSRA